MKHHIIALSIIATMLSASAYASTKKDQPAGGIHLDQSQDVFFEQFTPSTYSLELLQAKNSYNMYDLILGGSIEADLQHWQGDTLAASPPFVYNHGGGFYLYQATLDAMANMSTWLTGFLSVADSHVGNGTSSGNYTYIPHAFVLLGNDDKSPVYLTLGINDVPFGVFTGTGTWDMPLTAAYFDPLQAPQLSIAYNKNGFNALAMGMRDETNYDYSYVYAVSYTHDKGDLTYVVGAGYLTDLRTNNTGNSSLRVVRRGSAAGQNMGSVVDINGSIQYKQVELRGEYDTGQMAVAMNRRHPAAYSLVLTYTPTIAGQETTFGISQSRSYYLRDIPTALSGRSQLEQVASGLKTAWAASVTRPIFTKFFVVGLDVEKATTYANRNTYTGTLDVTVYI